MTYDPASYELAEYFLAGLPSTKEDIDSLAQTIQTAIESWLRDYESDIRDGDTEAAGPPGPTDGEIDRALDRMDHLFGPGWLKS